MNSTKKFQELFDNSSLEFHSKGIDGTFDDSMFTRTGRDYTNTYSGRTNSKTSKGNTDPFDNTRILRQRLNELNANAKKIISSSLTESPIISEEPKIEVKKVEFNVEELNVSKTKQKRSWKFWKK